MHIPLVPEFPSYQWDQHSKNQSRELWYLETGIANEKLRRHQIELYASTIRSYSHGPLKITRIVRVNS